MASYTYKNEADLAYAANKKRLRTEGQIILDRVMNESLNAMTDRFNEELRGGHIMQLEGSPDTLRGLLWGAAQSTLGPGESGDV